MRSALTILLTGAVLSWSASPCAAHHSFAAEYDSTKPVTLTGAVTKFDWTNPHAYIYLDVKDAKGAIEKWSVEMGTIGMLARAGWKRDTVKPGDEITVTGNRAKDSKPFLRLIKLVFANGQELTQSVQ